VLPLAEILTALDADRAAMAAFERADRAGPKDIRDDLALWRADLVELERLAGLCAPDLRAFDLRPMGSLASAAFYRRRHRGAGWILSAPRPIRLDASGQEMGDVFAERIKTPPSTKTCALICVVTS
jgi:hypothetical protein